MTRLLVRVFPRVRVEQGFGNFEEERPQAPERGRNWQKDGQDAQGLRQSDQEMIALGQYLQPTRGHLPVLRYVEPARFSQFEHEALAMGFRHAACGPLVRSSYHADQQAHDAGVVSE